MYIGVDLGGTNIAAGLVDDQGKLAYRVTAPTRPERGFQPVMNDIVRLCRKLMAEAGGSVASVGVGVPGLVAAPGHVLLAPNLGWQQQPVAVPLAQELGVAVHVANDASAAALAESVAGAARGYASAVMITLGTGVGGGLVIDGRLWEGRCGLAGEIGHIKVGENFYDCNCGANGCWETFCSATALVRYVEKLMAEGCNSVLSRSEELNARTVFAAAARGDAVADKAVRRMIKYLAVGILNLVNIFDPHIVVIGGGIAQAGPQLFGPLHSQLTRMHWTGVALPEVVPAQMGSDAGIIGAAMLTLWTS